MEAILLKIEELGKELFLNNNSLNTSSNITSISYGYKHVNNVQTDELCVVYTVKEKKPISELLPSEIISKTISIDNALVKTDVKELHSIELLVCNPACGQVAGPSSAANRAFTRPLMGGLSITSTNTVTSVGTMGFIAVHTATNTLVGVTNNHVVIQDAYIACDRGNSPPFENEYQPINSVYQNGEAGIIPPPNFTIGQTLKYKPIYVNATNDVDCAIFSLRQPDIDMTNPSTSGMQVGEAYTACLPFATTAEINNLLVSNPMLYSSGRTTGPKGGAGCPLRILSTFNIFSIFYQLQGVNVPCTFTNVLSFVKPEFDPSLSSVCVNPIFGGDSGSALIADFGGVRKIIGLVFASGTDTVSGNTGVGYACRIDVVAAQMGIQAWDCTNKGFVDESSIVYQTVPGLSCNETLQCSPSDPIYYQAGVTNTLSNPCPNPLINNFTTTWETTTPNETIQLPLCPTADGSIYSGTIDWGDGNITPTSYAGRYHTYVTPGIYTVIITGTCLGWNFHGNNFLTFPVVDRQKIKSVVHWGQLQFIPTGSPNEYMYGGAYFWYCTNLDMSLVDDVPNLIGVTSFVSMFQACYAITTINLINSWDTSAITTMDVMFGLCNNFNQPINFNTSAVTTMYAMFSGCTAFNSPVSLNTSAVTSMKQMFRQCATFNQPLSFDTSAVNNMEAMFLDCVAFNSALTFTSTALVQNMSYMFANCQVFNQPIGSWNTGAVTTMREMFGVAQAFNQPIGSWNTSSVTNMYMMLANAYVFDQNIGTWDVGNVTSFGNFLQITALSTTNLDNIYCGWLTVQPNITISFSNAQFTNATGLACKNVLQAAPKFWNITDGGGV
jgi:surface protein